MPALGPLLFRAAAGYRRRIDERLAAAGFADQRFPDGLILRLCRRDEEVTISQIGRELSMTRQGASKLVAGMSERGYVTVERSSLDAREKVVRPTPRARARLDAARQARRELDAEVRAELGDEAISALHALIALLSGPEPIDLAELWRESRAEAARLDDAE
jgi:DNA-binding MarR family transcriptional regulator